ncbi:solute:sodium symporter family transporter [Luteitalea sp. TBR-22]|uniref:sodium:solute symporter n=1 Tax=Luteitalea sp. TBR-22 TaxID=2802971 RepID=UPI001AF1DA06|nr:sodium:solute symporter [Luteitalea sp. TBR-22]BCS32255.1 solute:sodium symporter family transporter [Luteitalea sp. TBR-22]
MDATAHATSTLTGLDWIMIALYFGVLGAVAWKVVSSSKNTADDYFLAGRNLSWWIVGASIFASNIGSEHVVGLAGSGAADGVAMAHYELHAWCLLVLGWVFVPFYMRSQVFTMPEFLERRFSPASRYVLSIVSLITFVISKIAVGIFAGGVVFSTLLPELHLTLGATEISSFWIGSILVIVLTGLYTALGGMRAVAYNDAVQVLVLISGSAALTFYGLYQLGGWGELRRIVGPEMFNLWKPLIPAGVEGTWAPVIERDAAGQVTRMAWYFNDNFPWAGMLFCAPIIGLWYWCTDQYIVQRALGAPNQTEARRGSIFAAFLKLFPVYLFLIPGLVAFALSKSGKVPGLEAIATDRNVAQAAFPMMVQHLLPAGLRGLVVAGLLSALMGSLAGVFNACSTLFTVDLYSKINPHASQEKIVSIGRTATIVMVVIALAWLPVIQGAHGLYNYLQAVQSYLAPPVFVVFFLGVFWKRMNWQGCLWAMIVGFAMGLLRMAVDTPVSLGMAGFEHGYPEGSLLWIVNRTYFQYFGVLITLVSAVVAVVVSLATPPPDYARIGGLTYATATDADHAETRDSWDWRDVAGSAFVLSAILGAYLYFRG